MQIQFSPWSSLNSSVDLFVSSLKGFTEIHKGGTEIHRENMDNYDFNGFSLS
jgi:hypothetical protein